MITITPDGVLAQRGAVSQLRTEFTETGCAMMPGFLTAPLLELIMRQLETARFETTNEVARNSGRVFGNTLKLPASEPGIMALNFVLNQPSLFDLARQIGGTPTLANFTGRLHRTTADADQHIEWHHDDSDFRAIGLDINLSSKAHTGGVFQIRDSEQQIKREVAEWVPGDAFLFQIGNGWTHRLTRVESGERTVGVGWFRTQPEWKVLYGFRAEAPVAESRI